VVTTVERFLRSDVMLYVYGMDVSPEVIYIIPARGEAT